MREGRAEGRLAALCSILRRLTRWRCGAAAEPPATLIPHLGEQELTSLVDRLIGAADGAEVLAGMRADPRNAMPAPARPPREIDGVEEPGQRTSMIAVLDSVLLKFFTTGCRQGELDALRGLLYRNLHRRFGPTPEHLLAPIRHGGMDDLRKWIDRLLDADSDEQVIAIEV